MVGVSFERRGIVIMMGVLASVLWRVRELVVKEEE